ncbi:MAG: PP2C family protein-serine/threonine phosphatase [Candidatus Xenobia bacterium]
MLLETVRHSPVEAPIRRGSRVARILVVEDDEILLGALRMLLTREGYEVMVARTGEEALDRYATCEPHVVLADWGMPELDGVGMLRRIRHGPQSAAPYFILMTGRGDTEDRIIGLSAGADDYLVKPFDYRELMARIGVGVRQVMAMRSVHAEMRRLEAELRRAQAAQFALLPERSLRVPGVRWDYRFSPCDMLSGDGLDLFFRAPGEVVLSHFDVCGHGVQAAMHAVSVQRLLRCYARPLHGYRRGRRLVRPSPRQVVAKLNRALPMARTAWMFSLFVAVLDLHTRRLTWCRAGHPPPLVRRADGEVTFLEAGGMLVGLEPHEVWQEESLDLQPGDRLVVYSDCLIDATNVSQEMYGAERLARLAQRNHATISALLDAVECDLRAYAGADTLRDDFSLLALEVKPT